MYYRNAAAAVVVYDITKAVSIKSGKRLEIADYQASLEKAKAWVKELQRQANPNIVIALVGNKVRFKSRHRVMCSPDSSTWSTYQQVPLRPNNLHRQVLMRRRMRQQMMTMMPRSKTDDNVRQVSREEAEAYAKECGLLFFEASAKTGSNVGEVFTEIGESQSSILKNLLTRQLKLFRLTPPLPSPPATPHEMPVLLSLKSASTLTKGLKQRKEAAVDS
jgi:Ras-related protein Rab-5C